MAVTVTREFVSTARGIGKPDYTRIVSAGQVRAGISVEYGETLKMFSRTCNAIASPFAWFRGQLAIGESDSLVDVDTNLEMPFNFAVGYAMDLMDRYVTCDGDVELSIYFDTFLVIAPMTVVGGDPNYINQIQPYSTRTLDPTGASPHAADARLTNLASVAIDCSSTMIAKLIALGTEPLSDIKPIKCKHCGNIDHVPYQTTNHICTKCGKLTIVFNMRDIKHF